MIYHFVVGDEAAKPLQECFSADSNASVIVLKDILNLGPIAKEEGQSFSEVRTAFWQSVIPSEKDEPKVDDMERLLEVSKQMFEDSTHEAWFWMAPLPADICAYYWLLPYLSKHSGRMMLLNITGLPFLNESGKLFFPKSIAEISAKEIVKATKLARAVTPSELEVDLYEWKQLQNQNAPIRVMAGGKKIQNETIELYDQTLLSYCNSNFQKAHKIIGQALSKNHIPTGDLFLMWRLRNLVQDGSLQIKQESNNKASRDFEVRLFQETTTVQDQLL